MGANAQTAVPAFVSGEILTAAEMTQVNTGIPVFATTVTRDAAFGGTGEKVLAQGQYAFIEATNETQYYNGSAWVAVGASGLTLIKSETIGSAVGSVTVTGAFSSTYENYRIILSGGVASADNFLNVTLGSTATGYYRSGIFVTYASTTVNGISGANTTSWANICEANANGLSGSFDLFCPNLVKNTTIVASTAKNSTTGYMVALSGYLNDTTQYTAFTLTPSTGTLTGGTIRVYGYANS
jgi:hypothetical protein